MPFLALDSGGGPVTVNVAERRGMGRGDDVGGSFERAFDGSARQSVRYRKARWSVRTTPMTRTDADTLRAVLEATPPLTATGDLVSTSTSVFIPPDSIGEAEFQKLNDAGTMTDHVVLEFEMLEA